MAIAKSSEKTFSAMCLTGDFWTYIKLFILVMVIWPNYCDYLHNCHQNGYRTGPPKECSYTADNYSPQTKLIPCSTNMLKRMCRPSFLPLEYLTNRKKTKSIFPVIWHIDSNGFRFQKVRFMTYIKSPENTPISLTDFASKLDPKSNSGKKCRRSSQQPGNISTKYKRQNDRIAECFHMSYSRIKKTIKKLLKK